MRKCLTWMTFVGLLLAAGFTTRARGDESPPAGPKPEEARPATTALPPSPPGLKALLDPATGKFTDPQHRPVSAAPSASATSAASSAAGSPANLATSHEGLVAVRGTSRAGGVRVDLKGRFQSAVVATVDPDGKVTTACVAAGTREGEGDGHAH